MKFASAADADVPIDHMFARVSDFERLERAALRRGADVERLDNPRCEGAGAAWKVLFTHRGKAREMNAKLVEHNPPETLLFQSEVGGLGARATVHLVALSKRRTRLNLTIDLSATGFTARLLLQSLKLGKTTMEKRLKKNLKKVMKDIEADYAKQA